MAVYKMIVAYKGTAYYGWQRQPDVVTVVSVLEQCFFSVFKQKISISGASRTDAGVHALGQVASFTLDTQIAPESLLFAWNNALPADIVIKALLKIFKKKENYKINIIGNRHGEKKHESLLTREEISKAKDLGQYFKVSSDIRDLNYDLYFSKGNKKMSEIRDYSSNTVKQLSQKETEKILLSLKIFHKTKNSIF